MGTGTGLPGRRRPSRAGRPPPRPLAGGTVADIAQPPALLGRSPVTRRPGSRPPRRVHQPRSDGPFAQPVQLEPQPAPGLAISSTESWAAANHHRDAGPGRRLGHRQLAVRVQQPLVGHRRDRDRHRQLVAEQLGPRVGQATRQHPRVDRDRVQRRPVAGRPARSRCRRPRSPRRRAAAVRRAPRNRPARPAEVTIRSSANQSRRKPAACRSACSASSSTTPSGRSRASRRHSGGTRRAPRPRPACRRRLALVPQRVGLGGDHQRRRQAGQVFGQQRRGQRVAPSAGEAR